MREIRGLNDFVDVTVDDNVIITFYNSWCPICKMVQSSLEQFVYYHPEIVLARMNVNEQPQLASNLSVVNVPMTFIYKDGKLFERISGMPNLEHLSDIYYSMGNDFDDFE